IKDFAISRGAPMEIRAIPGGNPLGAVAHVLSRHVDLAVLLVGPTNLEAAATLGERFLDARRGHNRRGQWRREGADRLRRRARAKARSKTARGQREHADAPQTAKSCPPGSTHIAPYRQHAGAPAYRSLVTITPRNHGWNGADTAGDMCVG